MSDEFRRAIVEAGFCPPDFIQPSRFHRFPGIGKSNGNRAGWCLLFDDCKGGVYGDWSSGFQATWLAKLELSTYERKAFYDRVKKARKQAELEREKSNLEAAREADKKWNNAKPETGTHRYLREKGIHPHGIRTDGFNLLVPVRSYGELWSIQTIDPTGKKRFLKDGRTTGCYYPIGKPNGVLCLAEGFATAATIHEVTGYAVAVCFNAGNLKPVAESLSQKLPNTSFIICADDDCQTPGNPGITKAKEAAAVCNGVVAIPQFNNKNKKMTDFNDMARESGLRPVAEIIEAAIARGPETASEAIEKSYQEGCIEPQPLHKEPAPPLPFPMDALGTVAGDAARAIQRVIKAPDAICGQSLLAALAQLAQGHADISVDGRRRPISEFFVCVGETGERKSAVDDVATWPHRKRERDLAEVYEKDFTDYEMEHTAWKMARDDGLKKAKGFKAKRDFLEEIGQEPKAPPRPVVLIEEPTYEGLIKVLQYSLPSVGLFSDEGGRFVGGHALNSDNALKTAAGISSLWDTGSAKRTRAADGHSAIYGKRLSMHLMMQGIVAEKLMGNDLFREQGWLSRTLISWPESTVGKRGYVEENIFHDPGVKRYHNTCFELSKRELPTNEANELNPPILELSPQAKRLWIPFHDYCDREAKSGRELEAVRGLANKAPEHAVRLAGILSVVKGASVIGTQELESGIELMNFYLNDAIRMADTGHLNPDLKDAASLLGWLNKKGHSLVYPSLIYQKGPIRRLREKETALKAIKILENHGWLLEINPTDVDGKRRREVWRLIRV